MKLENHTIVLIYSFFQIYLICLGDTHQFAFAMATDTNNNMNKNGDTKKKKVRRARHFVFGYGSLMNPDSRAKTNPGLADQDGLPVVVRDVERIWSARTTSGFTAMGVRIRKGADCTGVLLEVNKAELEDLDRRELSYVRVEVHLDNVDQVPFLNEEEFYETEQAETLFEAKENEGNIRVWVYIQKDPIPADSSHPILQSYVDVILSGCLSISEDFARSFIQTTKGWQPNEDSFVDDRDQPIYGLANSVQCEQNADVIDQLLEEQKPKTMEQRVDYDPETHLENLKEAYEDDLAHPRAIKRAEARVESLAKDDTNKEEK